MWEKFNADSCIQSAAIFEYKEVCVLVSQSCWTLGDPLDCSPLGFSVHGILQARILEYKQEINIYLCFLVIA